jgi:hypothetical protein
MTDVYIAYAREDRERVRTLSDMLRFEGWDVWLDPTDPTPDNSAAVDLKLGSAGAILAVWSGYSRGSEQVRSEAATGLYKNKLIQVRIDHSAPPRPFDQVEVIDLGLWTGERDDPHWRRVLSAVRLYAGAPGNVRPQVTRRPMSPPAYLEPRRSIAWAPLIAAGVLVAAGIGVWAIDPFKWREPSSEIADATDIKAAPIEGAAVVETADSAFNDTEKSAAAWASVNRKDADSLRRYVAAYPHTSSAETARSLLRVLDAQAWVAAVTDDNEAGYQSYLKTFPADAAMPGAMAAAAEERLSSLATERTQAIQDIQKGLAALDLYDGEIDGKGGNGTARAVQSSASTHKRTYPTLSTAAPRDLRAFAEEVQTAVAGSGGSKSPIIAAATTSGSSAAEADRKRLAQAQAASQQAAQAATKTAAAQAALDDGADSLGATELQKLADANAWADADKAGTLAAYQNYLTTYPAGTQAAAARAAVTRLNKPAPFSLDLVPADVKAAADAARKAQATANSRAAQARQIAVSAENAPGAQAIVAANGDQYRAQISGGTPNGLGVRISADPANAGDRYRGEMRDGRGSGLGVYEFANRSGSSALRYEGEHAAGMATGFGVTYWKNGDTFAGQDAGASGRSRGVLTFSNGQRYEGELRNGTRDGLGVVWAADGSVVLSGRWANGELVEPMTVKTDGSGGQ